MASAQDRDIEKAAVIDLQDPVAVDAWCKRLGTTAVQLKAAVGAVGADPEVVRRYMDEQARKRSQPDELAAAERDLGMRSD